MAEIIKERVVEREKNYRYYIDSNGNLVRKKEHWLFNRYLIITLLVILAAGSYYYDLKAARDVLENPCIADCISLCRIQPPTQNSRLANMSALVNNSNLAD